MIERIYNPSFDIKFFARRNLQAASPQTESVCTVLRLSSERDFSKVFEWEVGVIK